MLTCLRSFFSIKLVNIVFLHKIINLFKLSPFNKLRNKNKFSIFNLTRNNNTSLFIIILIIIEVLLYLNKSIHFSIYESFTFLNLLNKRKMFHKLASCSNTSNPFFKCNIRLGIINFCTSKTSHHISSSLLIVLIRSLSTCLSSKVLTKFFNKNSIFTRPISFLIFCFYRGSYSINNSNSSETIILSYITNFINNFFRIK